ncbi:hypothetical protein GCM10027402_28520 [Arthrobacter monumenti]
MIEGKAYGGVVEDSSDGVPLGFCSIAACGEDRKIGREQEVGDSEYIPAGIPTSGAVAAQLFQVTGYAIDSCLLCQLSAGGGRQVFSGKNETTRQCEPAAKGLDEPGDEQDMQTAITHSQRDDVDRHCELRGWRQPPLQCRLIPGVGIARSLIGVGRECGHEATVNPLSSD